MARRRRWCFGAHPRSRGEHVGVVDAGEGGLGSSPLTRGAPFPLVPQPPPGGLIPAHAGSTGGAVVSRATTRAHPRSRGEHQRVEPIQGAVTGSSPLTRGARSGLTPTAIRTGLIPAHAGSTRCRSGKNPSAKAHPRSRGEHERLAREWAESKGSSPLTRGARQTPHAATSQERLIPAHAGSTTRCSTSTAVSPAHPRSRGEHQTRCVFGSVMRGSSPLTRGAHEETHRQNLMAGLIPAHAGSTTGSSVTSRVSTAHPRSRGEHDVQFALPETALGSSPLTRGAHSRRGAPRPGSGLIPAHAGSTSSQLAMAGATTAHPRSRGEHAAQRIQECIQVGSSPLTRGARVRKPVTRRCVRLIPAHAGSTVFATWTR